ncbi:MAG: hypothetical protein N4A33_00920 [Bacteriovoracaceae bacterium]|nr:hypothetical protein [Bacteriovoracaceae bacterium]
MKLLLLLVILSSFSSFAGTYTFQIKEYDQPHILVLETNEENTVIKKFKIYDSRDGKVLFNIAGTSSFIESDEEIYYEGNLGEKTITFEDNVSNLTSQNDLLINPWGDSEISREYTYAIFVRFEVTNNKIIGGRLEIANNQIQEIAMWGDLVTLK